MGRKLSHFVEHHQRFQKGGMNLKRIASLALIAMLLLGATGCALFETIKIDAVVTIFTRGWQNSLKDDFVSVFADQVVIDGTNFSKDAAANYMADASWWNGFTHTSFVAQQPTINQDQADSTIDFTVNSEPVTVYLGFIRNASGSWKIESIDIHYDWRT